MKSDQVKMLITVITNVPFDELFLPPKSLPRPTVALTLCERGNRKKARPHNKFIVPMTGSTYLKSGTIATSHSNPSASHNNLSAHKTREAHEYA
jgi:hypothetical protein